MRAYTIHIYIYIHICIGVYMCISLSLSIYIYIYTHSHTYTHPRRTKAESLDFIVKNHSQWSCCLLSGLQAALGFALPCS